MAHAAVANSFHSWHHPGIVVWFSFCLRVCFFFFLSAFIICYLNQIKQGVEEDGRVTFHLQAALASNTAP